jgi:hypothetical protein
MSTIASPFLATCQVDVTLCKIVIKLFQLLTNFDVQVRIFVIELSQKKAFLTIFKMLRTSKIV